MAAPQDAPEQGFRLRKFQGTQTEMDSTFIGPSFLVASENWIPTQSYRLGKRPGSTLVQDLGNVRVTSLLATHDPGGQLYLYAYVEFVTGSGPQQIMQMLNEGTATVDPPRANFPTRGALGRMIAFRDRVYAGNGVDPLVSWKLGDPSANTLTFTAIADDLAPAAPTATTSTTPLSVIPTGTYSFAWGRFNTVTAVYSGRTTVGKNPDGTPNAGIGTFTVAPNTQSLSFPVPAHALGPNEVYRLFISPRNYPVQYATMQVDNQTTGPAVITTIDTGDARVPMAGGTNVIRTGNMFVIWQNRVVFSGMASDPTSVFATDTILPGTEQQAFNLGTLFPDFAKVALPQICTGIGVCGVTSEYDPTAPLLFFTRSKTFIVSGDPFDPNGAATLVEVSSRVGCIGHDSIVATPVGTIWCGLDSIYLMPPGGGYPQDIGWPIANQIRQIPVAQRQQIVATFHRQFYKLAIPEPGGTTNTAQWWLDLRGGASAINGTPSWWGPMTGFSVTALTADPASGAEIDRCYGAIPSTQAPPRVWVLRLHQLGTYTDALPDFPFTMPIRSRLQSGRFDADQPFIVKICTRIRLISQTGGLTQLHVFLATDGGVTWPIDPILLGQDMIPGGIFVHLVPTHMPPPSNPPPNQRFCTLTDRSGAKFVSISPAEVQTIVPYDRPRGLSIQVTLLHDPTLDAQAGGTTNPPFFGLVELRDFELLFLLSGRKVRFLNERISK
jgi:hypothetical protein